MAGLDVLARSGMLPRWEELQSCLVSNSVCAIPHSPEVEGVQVAASTNRFSGNEAGLEFPGRHCVEASLYSGF